MDVAPRPGQQERVLRDRRGGDGVGYRRGADEGLHRLGTLLVGDGHRRYRIALRESRRCDPEDERNECGRHHGGPGETDLHVSPPRRHERRFAVGQRFPCRTNGVSDRRAGAVRAVRPPALRAGGGR